MSAIAFEDYLSEERKQEIAEAAFRDICEEKFRRDAERIFSNAAHEVVWKIVDGAFDGRAAEMIAAKVPVIIEGLTEYSIFRAKSVFDREESPGHEALKEAINKHKAALEDRVAHLAGEVTKNDVIEMLLDSNLTLKISAN